MKVIPREEITAALVRAILDYGPETGVFRWNDRTPEMFKASAKRTAEHACASWNSRFAGAIAGSPNSEGYLQISIFYRLYRAGRLAWLIVIGEWPDEHIDHENLDRADNRWINLRPATRSQNSANRRCLSNNASGFKGVYWDERRHKWQARIMVNGKGIHLGYFDAREEAAAAYQAAALKYFGEFARVA